MNEHVHLSYVISPCCLLYINKVNKYTKKSKTEFNVFITKKKQSQKSHDLF